MRGKNGHTPLQEAQNIEAEAVHRAALNLGQFMDDEEAPGYRLEVYRHLAKKYNKLLDTYRLDGLAMDEHDAPWGVIV